ncbi:MAG: dihydropyrimidinase [Oscillospiraceae bacterium]|nr:dihydropyrimidinase [Oscillospiraceae bacterium]MDD4368358.1 dihydropyrimidinase [Oscillospiraceae bacterium]
MSVLLKNGRIITASQSFTADLLLENEKIAALGQGLPYKADEILDVSGKWIFPGFIDAHTHLDMETAVTRTADDFASGTQAAILGGTTTIIDFATQDRGHTLKEALSAWQKKAEHKSACDYAFHMAITDWNPQTKAEMTDMQKQGVSSYKLYMAYDNLRLPDDVIFEIMLEIKRQHAMLGVHCENGDLVNGLIRRQLQQGHTAPLYHPLSRPAEVEAEAVERYLTLAGLAELPVNIVHLSTALSLEKVRTARSKGQTVFVETCPQYLLLDAGLYAGTAADPFSGARYVCSPPLRSLNDQKALWQGLIAGEIDTVSTDHCSFNYYGQKDLGRDDFSKIPNGLPGIEHRPSLMYTAGVAAGRISPERLTALLSENIARQFGLYPQKGVIQPGSDADLVIWQPEGEGVIRAATQHQRVDYTPYEGFKTQGCVSDVYLRGQAVVRQGQLQERKAGQYVRRGPASYRRPC